MATPDPSSIWRRGDAYERYVGRWSRLVASEFLAWLDIAPGRQWLDAGCGTGALTAAILATADPADVIGVDPSEAFLALARTQVADPRATFLVGDARELPLPSADRDVVVGGLMLNFVPEPATAIAEFARVVRPGGTVAAYVWDYAEGMQFMRHFWDAATALDPAAGQRDEGKRFDSVTSPAALAGLWTGAGLGAVETSPIDIPTRFTDFDDFWSPFLGGQGPGPAYVATLEPAHRDALRDHLRGSLPIAPDGSIPLTARALAVRGRR